MRKSAILGLLTLLCLVGTVVLWFVVNGSQVSYTKVEATVLTSDSQVKKVAGSRQTIYRVTVRYQGKTYELQNVHGSAGYIPGRTVQAYLADENLYANEAGVRTATPLSAVYFVGLFGTAALLVVTLTVRGREKKRSGASGESA